MLKFNVGRKLWASNVCDRFTVGGVIEPPRLVVRKISDCVRLRPRTGVKHFWLWTKGESGRCLVLSRKSGVFVMVFEVGMSIDDVRDSIDGNGLPDKSDSLMEDIESKLSTALILCSNSRFGGAPASFSFTDLRMCSSTASLSSTVFSAGTSLRNEKLEASCK